MLPHKHFLVAGLTIAPVAVILFPEKSYAEVVRWALAGGFLSAAIDLDVYAIVLLKSRKESRLKPFRSLLEIHRRFGPFMDTIVETGLLKDGIKTHFLLSALLILISYFFWNAYFIPVSIGAVSHIISDMPNIVRLIKLSKN